MADLSCCAQELRGLSSVKMLPQRKALTGWEIVPLEFDEEYVNGTLKASECWQGLGKQQGDLESKGRAPGRGTLMLFRANFVLEANQVGDLWVDMGDEDSTWNKGLRNSCVHMCIF